MTAQKTFLYFAYGSNLLRQRILIRNPTALMKGVAILKNYRLTFHGLAISWHGSPANIVEDDTSHVCGAIWELNKADEDSLDKQEDGYDPISVNVTMEGAEFTCRCYKKVVSVDENEGLPCPQYMDVIIRGAVQSQLPDKYIEKLKSITTNDYTGHIQVYSTIMKDLEEHS